MADLPAFLVARFDEAAATALDASPGPWQPNAEGDEVLAADGITVADGFALSGRQLRATVSHIVGHDPMRALADIEAKRAIVERYVWLREHGDTGGAAWVLPLLAAAYADHPDYREEWRPARS